MKTKTTPLHELPAKWNGEAKNLSPDPYDIGKSMGLEYCIDDLQDALDQQSSEIKVVGDYTDDLLRKAAQLNVLSSEQEDVREQTRLADKAGTYRSIAHELRCILITSNPTNK